MKNISINLVPYPVNSVPPSVPPNAIAGTGINVTMKTSVNFSAQFDDIKEALEFERLLINLIQNLLVDVDKEYD